MARPETPYEIVAEICRKLDQQGKDPSYGLVAAELPGNPSKGTILKHLRAYKDRRDLAATVDSGLSDSFMQAAKAEIAGHLTRTTEALEKKVQEANQAADEALAELDKSEARVEALEEELKTERKNGESYRQEAEKKEAVALQKLQGMEKRIQELEQERDQLIKAGESSRTEAAKAQMQVERADRAAALAEEKMKVLEEKLTAALALNTGLEKRLAVTEAKREALEATERTRTLEARESIQELEQERDQLIKAGESSRTEAAKAQMQVERADRAAALAEEKMKVLEEKLTAALALNTGLEKRLAVTEAKREALEATERTRTLEARESIQELKQELGAVKIALEEERKERAEVEKKLAGKQAAPVKTAKAKS